MQNPDLTAIKPQPGPQTAFLSSVADVAIFGGAAGGGKSFALLLEPCFHVGNRKFRCVCFRRTMPMIRAPGGLWDASHEIFPRLGAVAREQACEWIFPTGASIKFSGLEMESDSYNWQGSEIALILWDELTQFSERQFFYLLSRNRSTCGVRPYIRATTNPDADSWLRNFLRWWVDDATGLPIPERAGKLRWFIRRDDTLIWGDTRQELVESFGADSMPKSVTFIPASVYDNKALLDADPAYVSNLKALPLVERERLLRGNWNIRAAGGNFFRREWFRFDDRAPAPENIIARCRFWDRAASEQRAGTDPDASVGLLLGKDRQGVYYVLDVKRFFATPGRVEQIILDTARQDGISTTVAYHQDPASAGKFEAEHMSRVLDGFSVRFATATGDKATRAKPISAQAEAGNVRIVRSHWNDDFLRELESFPDGVHDDQVDALSGAHGVLCNHGSGGHYSVIAPNLRRYELI